LFSPSCRTVLMPKGFGQQLGVRAGHPRQRGRRRVENLPRPLSSDAVSRDLAS
jgi:hypothetical protein